MRIPNVRSIQLSTLVVALAAGCAHTVPKELADARQAFVRAQNGPARDYNPAELHVAESSLRVAEATFDDEGGTAKTRDRAYVAMRKAQNADVQARTLASQQEEQKYQQQAAAAEKDAYARTRDELQNERARREQAEQQASQAAAELARIAAVKQDQRGMVITLSGEVLFKSGQSELMPSARDKLSQVASSLKQGDPSSSIVIEGHTDSQGSDTFNQRLSQSRADAVREYLVSQGLTQPVQAVGKGESEPIADNDSPEGRANNRRVEIVVKPGSQQQGNKGAQNDTGAPGAGQGGSAQQPTQPGAGAGSNGATALPGVAHTRP